jgi:hypothetical protein
LEDQVSFETGNHRLNPLLAVVLQQIPGIVWAPHPPKADPFAHNSGSVLVETLEKTFGIATVGLLVLVLARVPVLLGQTASFFIGAFVVLAIYYGFYVLYSLGVTSLPVLLGMAVSPPVCFMLVALYQGNCRRSLRRWCSGSCM